jgi:pimeloyl-ACP methyl ester carboxylesterase
VGHRRPAAHGASRQELKEDAVNRRTVIASLSATALAAPATRASEGFVQTHDGLQLAYRDSGAGSDIASPVVFIHGWSLAGDIWQPQIDFLRAHGHRAVVYDRRGHGDSSKPAAGFDYDSLADDLAVVLGRTGATRATLVGHSMGSGEIARYVARHGQDRLARIVFVAPTTPFVLRTADNPDGTDRRMFDQLVSALEADPKGYLAAGAAGLLGENAHPETVKWALDMAWRADPQALEKCLRAFTETDFRNDLQSIRVPSLILYGSGDMPSMHGNARRTAAAIAGSRIEVYEGAPHGLFITDRERFNDDLLRFIRS